MLLAAGTARRFGTDKLLQLLTLRGVTLPLAAHSVQPWLASFAQLTVVVRPDAQTLCSVIESALEKQYAAAIKWVLCADAGQGMASSLACGIRANHNAAGWLVGLADMPIVPASAIAGVRDALASGAALAAPCNKGRRGHPVGFSAGYRAALLSIRGDAGARHLLERDKSKLATVEIDDAGIFADIDTPADLQQM